MVVVKELSIASGVFSIEDQLDLTLKGQWPKRISNVDYLVVGGGSGGNAARTNGSEGGGGGGAGGLVTSFCTSCSSLELGLGTYAVTVGGGGAGGPPGPGPVPSADAGGGKGIGRTDFSPLCQSLGRINSGGGGGGQGGCGTPQPRSGCRETSGS